jgi:hypothetical protein
MRQSWTENTISEGFSEAYFEISILADEMREAFENTPEQFKENSGKDREVAADTLESVINPSLPVEISGKEHWIGWIEKRPGKDGKMFRPARRDNAVICLKAGLAYAIKFADSNPKVAQFVELLKIDIHNLETIHFPGMAGR